MRKIKFIKAFGGSEVGEEVFREDNMAARLVKIRKVAKYIDDTKTPTQRKAEADMMKAAEQKVKRSVDVDKLRAEVKAEILATDYYELKALAKNELKEEYKDELLAEIKGELKAEKA